MTRFSAIPLLVFAAFVSACNGPTRVSPTAAPTLSSTPVATTMANSTSAPRPNPTQPLIVAASPQSTASPPANPSPTWTFDAESVSEIPSAAQVFSGNWAIRAESDAPTPPNALCQTGNATFPAIALSSAQFTNVVITTRFKPISGNEDRAAGIIFRILDKDNFYVARANALENNVNLYIYERGQRRQISGGTGQVISGQWQALRVEMVGERIRAFLNGQLVVEGSAGKFKEGGIGLWTKADSVTCFDDVQVSAPKS